MPIKTDARFMYWGTAADNFSLAVPFPSMGSAQFATSRSVDAARNGGNVVVGQQVGRSVDKQSMKWGIMPREKWWEINKWLEANGMFFWCRYFSHNVGEWKIRKFYVGDISAQPVMVDPETGIPAYYKDAGVNVIDTGAGE